MLDDAVLPYILMVIAGFIVLGVGLLFSFRTWSRWQERRELMASRKPDVADPTAGPNERQKPRPTD
jgi:hypothetical protein